jgi:type 1 glutamine amidotransferase
VLALLLASLITQAADAPLKICLLSASAEYDSEKSLGEFQKYLESHYQVICQRVFGKDKGEGLPGLEAIDNTDLIVVFTRRIKLPPDQLERIHKYIAARRPIIGIRTASHAFENFLEFDHDVLGGGYKGHYTNSVAQIHLVSEHASHPVLKGVTPFTSRKLYKNPTHAEDDTVLLEGTIPGHREPVAWVRQHNGERVFYTSLGVQEDFVNDNFRRLLVNAVFWATGRDETALRK